MSLINDALKRARQEALRQEAESRGTSYWAVPAHARRVRVPWWLFVGGAAATVLVLAGLVTLWPRPTGSPGTGSGPRQDVSSPAAQPASPPVVEQTPAPASTSPLTPVAAPSSSPSPAQVGTAPTPVDEAATGLSPSRLAAEEPAASPQPPPTTRPTETPRRRAAPAGGRVSQAEGERLEQGATYVRRAVASDGSVVELGGIAYSDTRPIAVINGSVVSPEDMIAGFTVVAIEPERVELETDGVRIYLTLR